MLRSLKLLPSSSRLLVKTATTTRIVNRQSTLTSKKKPSAILDYAELSKYRLSSLVVLTTGAGFVCAGAPIDWLTMGAACVGTGLCASSASTFNQIIEKDRDARMNRTMHRPMPSGRVTVDKAKAWGVGTGVAGTSLLLATTNPVVAGLGLTNIVLYGGIYTYSKQYTEWNTWIGSLVGAIPPLMGWAAASNGNLLAQEPIALATLLFLWQFPHFFALSWMYKEDYARGGFKMVSLNDVDGKRSAELIFEYSVYMSLFPLIVSACGLTSSMFLIEGTLANSYLLLQARNFYNKRSNANARKVFLCSLWYLPLMLTAFVFHSQIWNEDTIEENIDENDETQKVLGRVKQVMKGLCVHEVFAYNDKTSAPNMCPKISTDKAVEEAELRLEVLVETAAKAKGTTLPLTSDEVAGSNSNTTKVNNSGSEINEQ